MSGGRILFVTYGGGHADIVARIVPVIESFPGLQYEILALTTAGTLFERTGIRFKRCRDYLPLSGYETALNVGAKLSEGLWNASSGVPFDETCCYLGVSMLDLVAEHGEDIAVRLYEQQGRKAFLPERFIGRLLDIEKPDLVVTTCHVRMERAAVRAAKARKIPTVLIEDLLGYSMLGENSVSRNVAAFDSAEWPDHILVMNEFVRQRHIQAGFSPKQVHVTGQPVFSQWVEEYDRVDAHPRLVEERTKGRRTVTYVAPARRDILFDQARAIVEMAGVHPEWQISIKLHPSTSREEFLEVFSEFPSSVVLFQEEDVLPIVKGSDAVVLFRSTVGLLCVFYGIPLVVADWTGEPEVLPYVSSGVAYGAFAPGELAGTVAQALRLGIPGDGLKMTVFENPVRAEHRIASFLAGCLGVQL